MKPLSYNLSSLGASKTVALDSRAKQMLREGKDIINLGSGEPEITAPETIQQAAIKAITSGLTKYSDPTGIPDLKQAIQDKLKRDQTIHYDLQSITVSSGVKHALFNSLAALLNPGDEVVIPTPHWVTYPSLVKSLGAKPVLLLGDPHNHYKISAEGLADVCNEKTKVVILNSPCNPTGAVYTKPELAELGKIILEHDIYCISDEIYEHLIYTEEPHCSIAGLNNDLYERTIILNGVSKAYAMTGYRIGFSACPAPIAKIIGNFQSQSVHHPSTPAQYAALEAFQQGGAFITTLKDSLTTNRNEALKLLSSDKNIHCPPPQGAFYLFPDINSVLQQTSMFSTSEDLCEYLLTNFQVATIPGSAFGLEGKVRLSFTPSLEKLREGISRFLQGIASLLQ